MAIQETNEPYYDSPHQGMEIERTEHRHVGGAGYKAVVAYGWDGTTTQPITVGTSGAISTAPQALTKRFDYANSALIYTATAPVGTADASTGWTITKFDLASSADASGKIATDVSWTNRASGSYN
jgi:hypothetical protein